MRPTSCRTVIGVMSGETGFIKKKRVGCFPLIVSGGKKCGGAAADGSEGKYSPA